MSNSHPFITYGHSGYSEEDCIQKSQEYYHEMNERRSLRDFSDKYVPKQVIENLIKTAGTAPSGAHKQPWHFCAISNSEIKREIRIAAEKEEYEFYHGRASEKWLEDLSPFGTDWHKPFLEIAPWLIVVFKKSYNIEGQDRTKNYYVQESVGIATGMLISAIHKAGLVTLTHTPSPMNFLTQILNRPENEKPFLLLPIGYPAKNALIPDIKRKSLDNISDFYS